MAEAGWTRERKLVDELLTFIEQTSGRKIKFSAIANLKTGVIEDPQDRIAAWLKRHLADSYQRGRVEGLREAAEMVEDDCYIEGGELLPDYEHRCKHNVNQKELAGKIRFRANDLAQQAQGGV